MPPVRRRALAHRARLGGLWAMRLQLGAWVSFGREPEARRLYVEHRDELLDLYPVSANGPEAFWAFDPSVPDELRSAEPAERATWLHDHRLEESP